MTRVDEIAAALVAAHRSHRPFVADAANAPMSSDEAYAIQDAVAAGLFAGQRPATWKVGASTREVEPTATPLFTVLASPARWTSRPIVDLSIEAEIGFSAGTRRRAAEVATVPLDQAFDYVCATIEVCDARLANYRDAPALWKLADAQVNAGLGRWKRARRRRGHRLRIGALRSARRRPRSCSMAPAPTRSAIRGCCCAGGCSTRRGARRWSRRHRDNGNVVRNGRRSRRRDDDRPRMHGIGEARWRRTEPLTRASDWRRAFG